MNILGYKLSGKVLGIIGAGFVALLLIIWFIIHQSVISSGNKQEATMSGDYADGANYLSNCVIKTKQAANVTVAQTDALDKILSDAVSGRYGTGANFDGGSMISAIVEAYPDTSGLSKSFQDALSIIAGCQDDFRNKQSKILDDVRSFRSWKTGSWPVRTFGGGGFPNDNLYISIGDLDLTGDAALKKMSKPIVETSILQDYATGTTNTENPFATEAPSDE
jgi:hypothetical protein